jgi:hypothetical protein
MTPTCTPPPIGPTTLHPPLPLAPQNIAANLASTSPLSLHFSANVPQLRPLFVCYHQKGAMAGVSFPREEEVSSRVLDA